MACNNTFFTLLSPPHNPLISICLVQLRVHPLLIEPDLNKLTPSNNEFTPIFSSLPQILGSYSFNRSYPFPNEKVRVNLVYTSFNIRVKPV